MKRLSSIRKQALAIGVAGAVVLASAAAIAAARTPASVAPAPATPANAWAPSALAKQLSLARAATTMAPPGSSARWSGSFTSKPATPPLPGARYGSFGAGCHYADGTFVPANAQTACPKVVPKSGAAFTFWHPVLITMHVWLWYPSPTGLFASTNPLAAPFNQG